MFDAKGRTIHYLRLSVTDLCNLRCRYCMPDGVEKLEREDILTYEEFLRLAALFAQCGVDTVRVTGGEPLVRKGVDHLVAQLKAIPGIRRVTMTTNGVLLAQQLPALLAAGLDSVNISLDTLSPEVFARITARDAFADVMAGGTNCEIDKYCRFHAWNYRFLKFWILFEYDTEFARIIERRSRYDARRNGAKGFAKIPFDCKRTGHR